MFDTSTEFGQRLSRRLENERVIWLTTMSKSGRPAPRPVWFYWDEDSFLVYTRPNTFKIEHIRKNPSVSLHFDSDGMGGDIIIFSGIAKIDRDAPKADQVSAYVKKYNNGLKRINMTAEQFGESYSIAIRIEPTGVRGH